MPTTLTRQLLVNGLVLWAAAAATYGTLRLTYGDRPAHVHVRWASDVADDQRREQQAEALAQSGAASMSRVLRQCFDRPAAIRTLSVEGRRRPVDWKTWQFGDEVTVPIAGPIRVAGGL